MPLDNLTLALNGRLPLPLFAAAVTGFDTLVRALSAEVATATTIGWSLADLEGSVEESHINSASLTSVGESGDTESVERVVRAYGQVGKALEHGVPIPYSPPVVEAAKKVVGVLNGAITSIRFETPEEDATISTGVTPQKKVSNLTAYGAVEGTIQTLSRRKGLRFTLYDTQFDKAVSCYLSEGQEDLMRNAWGNRAIVEGRISRDPVSGRPLTLRRITAVEIVEDCRGGFRRARGAVRPPASMPPPEVLVRRLRDG